MAGKGVIGVVAGDMSRYTEFHLCLAYTKVPPGTQVLWQMGVNMAMSWNQICRRTLKEDFEWLWMLGDDHIWIPELLLSLLERDIDIVIPLVLHRQPPYWPVIRTDVEYKPVGYEFLHGKSGLIEIEHEVCGNAGMLVKRRVLEAMQDPWFEVGKINSELGSLDLWFCKKAKEAGFKIHLDLDQTMGHIMRMAVWPQRTEDGFWNAICNPTMDNKD